MPVSKDVVGVSCTKVIKEGQVINWYSLNMVNFKFIEKCTKLKQR